MRKIIFISFLLLLPLSVLLAESSAGATKLTIIWHQGVLGENLRALVGEYTKQSGVAVEVDLVPWDEWHDTIARDFASKTGRYDLTVFDSQSMSEFASGGHVLLLNSYLKNSAGLRAEDFDPTALTMYAEYPEGSADLYALPINQDTMGMFFRTDLFNDPAEKKAFREKYGYDLSTPETYSQFKDAAAFFTRPDKKLYGIALYGSADYDAVTSIFNNMLWSFGGELWDAKTRRINGVINSAEAIAALEYFKALFEYAPSGSTDWFYSEVNRAFENGNVAMGIGWYYFFAELSDSAKNSFADRTGFAPLPGVKGRDGDLRRFYMVGGQGISISRYSKHPEEAWKLLEWLMSKDVQWKWVRAGAQTGRIDILSSPEYLRANTYNSHFVNSMKRVKDYWHLIQYPQLLKVYQERVHAAVAGKISPKDALDQVAAEQPKLLN